MHVEQNHTAQTSYGKNMTIWRWTLTDPTMG